MHYTPKIAFRCVSYSCYIMSIDIFLLVTIEPYRDNRVLFNSTNYDSKITLSKERLVDSIYDKIYANLSWNRKYVSNTDRRDRIFEKLEIREWYLPISLSNQKSSIGNCVVNQKIDMKEICVCLLHLPLPNRPLSQKLRKIVCSTFQTREKEIGIAEKIPIRSVSL